jgi:hypothetical protein
MAGHDKYRRGQISPEILKQLKEQKAKKEKWHWSLTVTIIGVIAGNMLMLGMMSFTLMSYLYLVLAVLGIASLAFVIQWKYFHSPAFIQKNFRLPLGIYILYCVGGIAVPVCGILLLTNWMGASSVEDVEKHRVVGLDRQYILDSNYDAVLLLEGDAYLDEPGMRSFPYLQAIKWRNYPILGIVSNKGLLGIPVFKEIRLMPDPDQKPESETLSEPEVIQPEPAVDSLATDSSNAN